MKKIFSLMLTLAMLVTTVGCSSASSQAPVSSTAPASSTEAPSKSTAPALSGKVVVYAPSPAGLADQIAADFTAKTGVEVEMFQGTTGEILARLEAEKANPVADVIILASWTDGLTMHATGDLLSYVPVNAEKMNPDWVNAENTLFGYSASAAGVIYNTNLVKTLDADWEELATNEAYKDLLAIPDPIKSGSCKDFLAGFIYKNGDSGWTILNAMAKTNQMTVPGANKAALEAVTTGEKGILIAGVDYNAYSSIEKGEPLGIYYPASGTVINPRPAMILKSSQNVDNAKAFMDYLLSDEAQASVGEAYLLPGRSDITVTNRANTSEIPVFPLDWNWMIENGTDIAQKLLDICS